MTARLTEMDRDMTELFAASRDTNADDEHDPEGQTIAFERSQLASMIHQARTHLTDIEAAIARIDAGTYGVCDVCRQPISAVRLEAKPTATTCVAHVTGS